MDAGLGTGDDGGELAAVEVGDGDGLSGGAADYDVGAVGEDFDAVSEVAGDIAEAYG